MGLGQRAYPLPHRRAFPPPLTSSSFTSPPPSLPPPLLLHFLHLSYYTFHLSISYTSNIPPLSLPLLFYHTSHSLPPSLVHLLSHFFPLHPSSYTSIYHLSSSFPSTPLSSPPLPSLTIPSTTPLPSGPSYTLVLLPTLTPHLSLHIHQYHLALYKKRNLPISNTGIVCFLEELGGSEALN